MSDDTLTRRKELARELAAVDRELALQKKQAEARRALLTKLENAAQTRCVLLRRVQALDVELAALQRQLDAMTPAPEATGADADQ
jgi:hypothetical protein